MGWKMTIRLREINEEELRWDLDGDTILHWEKPGSNIEVDLFIRADDQFA